MNNNSTIPQGNEKNDYQARKKFTVDFYVNRITANTTKHIYNKSLNSFMEVK
jgi:hypothetical protein